MKFLAGAATTLALVYAWKKWSRPYLVWQFSRGDA